MDLYLKSERTDIVVFTESMDAELYNNLKQNLTRIKIMQDQKNVKVQMDNDYRKTLCPVPPLSSPPFV